MQLTLLRGYPDYIGKRFAFVGYGNGPASYVQVTATAGGDPLLPLRFNNYFDLVEGGLTVSRTYIVRPVLAAVGPRAQYRLMWVVAATGSEAAAALNLSAEQVQLGGFGGVY